MTWTLNEAQIKVSYVSLSQSNSAFPVPKVENRHLITRFVSFRIYKQHILLLPVVYSYSCQNAENYYLHMLSKVLLQKILEPEIKILREYFKPEMIKLFSLLLPNMTTVTFCSEPDNRFAWLKLYVC